MTRFAISVAVVWVLLCGVSPAAEPGGKGAAPAFQPGAKPGEFTFDTGALSGTLRPGGRSAGLTPLRVGGQQIAGAYGILSHYRLLTPTVRYGHAAWDIPSTATLADGAVEARWPAAKDRPFEMHARYAWAAGDTLDVVSTVKAQADLPRFEMFLASYFSGFERAFAYAQPEGGQPGFVEAVKERGVWQMFPRDARAVTLIQDGRWKLPPHPVDWAILPRQAGALAMRRDAKTGLVALVMARPGDCFALAMPFGAEGHRSLYLCLLGRDIPAGQSATAHARLVVAKDLSDRQAVERYEQFLKDVARDSAPKP
ncbi:MAG: hypothetical protein BWX88_00006 [Planctomycetes bacterium ADurb.Bin126]|nr:MAG: hypothetical protein BWX88_00006 [Planctomycetes bacterium ADurb.Bin126]HQL74586.1 hypothetical protein [Phycisphaerae bacterium]